MKSPVRAVDFERLFDASPAPYLVLYPDLKIAAANDAYLRATQRRREDLIGQYMFDAFPDNPGDANASGARNLRASFERVLKTRAPDTMAVQKYDIPRPAESGGGFEERYWSPVNSPVLDDGGEVAYILHRVWDVTDFQRIQNQLKTDIHSAEAMSGRVEQLETEMFVRGQERFEANLRLQEANEAMAALDRAKTEFFSNVSHELRTPLTLMLGLVEELLQTAGALDDDQRDSLTIVHRNALRLLKLVNALLEFARIEAGRIAAIYEPTDLASFTSELASVFRAAIEKAGLRLVIDCPPLPELVYVDHSMWEKVVLNLLSNAFKFTLQGEIAVSLHANGKRAELIIKDTGAGIAADEMPRLFERFHRVAGAGGRTQEGAGIGLALVRELVELHGGTIRAESILGEGSSFFVDIPFGRAHLPANRVYEEPHAVTPSSAGMYAEEAYSWLPREVVPRIRTDTHRPLILLAEDNADMRGYVTRLLSPYYDVEAVADGNAALAAMRTQPPELLITDVMMLGLNGVELVRAIRADAKTQTLPIIILSASATEEARIEGLQAGANDYLIKPFSARELLARIAGQLAQSEHARQVQALRNEAEAIKTQLQMTLESVNDAFVAVDHEWRIAYINSRAAQESRKPKDELIGGNVWDMFALASDDAIRGMLVGAMRDRQPARLEYRYAPTGNWWEVRASPSPQGLVITSTEITERKRAEMAMARENMFSDALIQSMPGIFFVLDGEGNFFRWNRYLNRLTARSNYELQGRNMQLAVADEDQTNAINLMHEAHESGYAQATLCLQTHQHGKRQYLLTLRRFKFGDEGTYLAVSGVDNTDQVERITELEHVSRTDPLTQVANRNYFLDLSAQEFARCRRYGHPFSMWVLDIDYFKSVNDTYGHQAGDAVLREFVNTCRRMLRDWDVFGRIGGEEFAVVLPETDTEQAILVGERLRQTVATSKVAVDGETSIRVTVSLGVATARSDDNDLHALLARADQALYEAKSTGRDKVCVATSA